ncbi:MAG: germination protein YpeB [Oscillospiraceae bacterium]
MTNDDQNSGRKSSVLIFIVSVVALVVVIIAIFGVYRAYGYKNLLEKNYMRAVETTATSITNIATDLEKGMYASSPSQMSSISSKLFKEASTAKTALAMLPVTELNLDNTNKFLSQVGNYALSLSKSAAAGNEITDEEYSNLQGLLQSAQQLRDNMIKVEKRIVDGELSIYKLQADAKSEQGKNTDDVESASNFKDIEDSFTDYPALIYDGPFSDHIMEKKSEMLKTLPNVSSTEAKKKAELCADMENGNLKEGYDENSSVCSYVFENNNTRIAVTKQGGLVNYMLKFREIGGEKITKDEAFEKATKHLEKLKIPNMVSTYYEIANGIMTINFAHKEGETVCYTDLIKIGVAMDNGEIVSFDARGYIINHKKRTLPQPQITEEQAKNFVSKNLKIESSKLALIPSSGKNEVFTYEFATTNSNNQHVLVYINAMNANEEQILLLIESDSGVLTK